MGQKHMLTFAGCVMALIALTACVTLPGEMPPGETPSEVDVAPTSLPQEPEPEDGSVPQPGKPVELPPGAVIVLRLTGGLAGLNEEWVIYADGRITTAQGESWQVSAERVQYLLAELEALSFFQKAKNYIPLSTCCDRMYYELIVLKDGKTARAQILDAAPNTPQEIWQAIDLVKQFLESTKP